MNFTKKTSIQLALALSVSALFAQSLITASAARATHLKAAEKTGEELAAKTSQTQDKPQSNMGNEKDNKHKSEKETGIVAANTGGKSPSGNLPRPITKVKTKTYKPKKVLASAEQGKLLYGKHNCAACHSAEGKGGCLAPPLDGIVSYHPKTYLIARITLGDRFEKYYATSHKNGELMPHPRVPFSESKLIVDYLASLPSLPSGYQMTSHGVDVEHAPIAPDKTVNQDTVLKLDPQRVSEGRKAFAQAGCYACHAIDGAGGRFAPKLNGIANRRSLDYVRKMIDRAELKPIAGEVQDEYAERGNIMPPAGLSDDDIENISQFLMSLK